MEIPTVIVCFCWSLLTCKKSNLSFWITLGTSDHFHLKWLKVILLLVPYHMQKTKFLTQLILEVKLTHYLLSFWECLVVPEHTHLKQPTNIYCFFWTFSHIQKFIFIPQVFCETLSFNESCILICFEVFWSTQEPDFCKHIIFSKSKKKTLVLCGEVFFWITLLLKSSKLCRRGF